MSSSAPIQDIRQLCDLYITDVPPNKILDIFITIAAINAVIFFSLWLPLIISLNIQPHHRLKRLSEILLRHRLIWFLVWPFLHASCGFLLILEGLVLHAGLACRHPFYSLTPLAGWLLFASQCTVLIVSALTIGICLRKEQKKEQKEQKKARKGKGRATSGEDVEDHDGEPLAMPAQAGSVRALRVLRGEDQHHRSSTVTTNSSRSFRPECFYWEGIEDLTKPVNMAANFRTRDPRDVDPHFTYAMARRAMGRTSDNVPAEDMQQPKRVRLPIGTNAEGSSKDVERLVARNMLAADVEGFPFPPTLPPRCLNRAGARGRNGEYTPLASEPFVGLSGRPSGRRLTPMDGRSFVPSRPSPLRTDSGYRPKSDGITATVPRGCHLDKLRGKGKSSEAVVFELTVPPSEDVRISLSRVTTSSSTSGLELLQRCPRHPSPDTRRMSPDSGVGLTEML